MSKKYFTSVRIPIEAMRNLKIRKLKIIEELRRITKKQNIKIPNTDMMRFVAIKPIENIYDDELIEFFLKKRRFGGNKLLI